MNDENIVKIVKSFKINDDRWANATVEIMPYYTTGSLFDMIRAKGDKCFTDDFLVDMTKTVAKALVALHSNKIVHRYVVFIS
mgnify:CR=1 FL=1